MPTGTHDGAFTRESSLALSHADHNRAAAAPPGDGKTIRLRGAPVMFSSCGIVIWTTFCSHPLVIMMTLGLSGSLAGRNSILPDRASSAGTSGEAKSVENQSAFGLPTIKFENAVTLHRLDQQFLRVPDQGAGPANIPRLPGRNQR